MRAAILPGLNEKLEVRSDVQAIGPGPGEVRVRVVASGVCHSDISAQNGTLPQPTPAVLGHEGAGEIIAVGEHVHNVAVGDHVIISWVPPCGECKACRRGQPNLCLTLFLAGAVSQRFLAGENPIKVARALGPQLLQRCRGPLQRDPLVRQGCVPPRPGRLDVTPDLGVNREPRSGPASAPVPSAA